MPSDPRTRKRGKGKIKVTKRQLVNNKELVAEIIELRKSFDAAREKHDRDLQEAKDANAPQEVIDALNKKDIIGTPSERLGEIFMDLVENYATKSNFSGYTYLDEMKSRAIFFLLKYSKSFNPDKSSNAFAYCTQIVKNAFIQVINKENKHIATKKALAEKYYRERRFDKKDDDLIFGG